MTFFARRIRPALRSTAIAAGIGLLFSLAGPGGAEAAAGSDPEVAGEVLVKLRSTASLGAVLSRHQLSLAGQFGARPIYRLKVVGNLSARDKAAALALDPDVLIAETNTLHQAPEARRSIAWAIGTPEAYAAQWAPAAIRLREAQARSTGAGVRVAVLDTGVDLQHPLLAGRLVQGFDFVDFDANPSELPGAAYGHGTHVAGLIAMTAPGAMIMPLRVLDPQGQGNAWVLAEAMLHAVDPDRNPQTDDGARVINLSLGSTTPMRVLTIVASLASCEPLDPADPANDTSDPGYNSDRERCAASAGAVIVAAAGNEGSRAERQYPAAESAYGKISVGASTAAGRLADFSNRGSWVDLAAPGQDLTSAAAGGGYATWSGTSMAAPLVAGTAALLRSLNPGMSAKDAARRIMRRGSALCSGQIPQLDALAVVSSQEPARLNCR